MDRQRRDLLLKAGVAGVGLLAGSCSSPDVRTEQGSDADRAVLSAAEELMRDHGVVQRLGLVYDHLADRLEAGEDIPRGSLLNASQLVDEFVAGYHEYLEEKFIFPLVEDHEEFSELISVLRRQHIRGRRLSSQCYSLAAGGDLRDATRRGDLIGAARSHTVMFRAHTARENTDLFGALHTLLSVKEFLTLRDKFSHAREEKLGEASFAEISGRLAEIEKELGIHALSEYTP
jgi:hemerythrin-like domain-containing protein